MAFGGGMGKRRGLRLGLAVLALCAGPVGAQVRPLARPATLSPPAPEEAVVPVAQPPAPVVPTPPTVGSETSLPLPRYVSLKTDEGNARRGPALDQRIDWVFVREDMPLRITAEYGHWRRVEDRDGQGGWVHYSLLSGTRTVLVTEDRMPLRAKPDEGAPGVALLEANVVARLESCEPDWCRITAGGYGGWAPKAALWGVDPAEVIE
ncbi:SH3 domain-containing protein [Rubellimicrobium aerolatum]|uniref:SH3 domain-containing protein n=1 Tax=Rubellimicrobium aerolatum TaxID=490979 RepID=A0ABW0SEH3_9RHOB|nr:SH3 domain-containing protein [Rubellimicrobium aerolatum]MBP1805792.1 SH3-like domain-containing protein [Rubellimicrobium aerolatum]